MMADPTSIYETVRAEQEKFALLTEQLAAERRNLANQLQKVHVSRDSGMSGSGYLDDHSTTATASGYNRSSAAATSIPSSSWNNNSAIGNGTSNIPEDYENDLVDPLLVNRKVDTKVDKKVYRSERIQRRVIGDPSSFGADGAFYHAGEAEEAPIHESRYTTTRTNCQPTSEPADNGSLGSNPNLVSRNTSSTTTQEVTTVTRVYRTYERVPTDVLSSGGHQPAARDYDYPEDYFGYDFDLYAKPHHGQHAAGSAASSRKYGSPRRFDYVNGDTLDSHPHPASHSPQRYSSASAQSPSVRGSAGRKGPTSEVNNYSGFMPANPADMDHYSASPSSDRTREATKYRDPDLSEVIEFLRNPSNVIKANAAAHLAHLSYMNDQVKTMTRQLGGIPILLEMLASNIPEIQRNACCALRNIAFGRGNDENKRAIRAAGGLHTLVKLLSTTQESEIGELVTAVLWILSSCDDLKKPILDEACPFIIKQIILPNSGYRKSQSTQQQTIADRRALAYGSTVFRNSSGVLRNVSSAGFQARKTLRESEDLIACLLHLVKSAVHSQDMDNKSIENVVCVLRNLSFRCQEVEDPDYDKKRPTTGKKEKGSSSAPGSLNGTPAKNSAYGLLKSVEALWNVENLKCYLSMLSNCANPDTLEAAAGIIQNLSACYWQPAVELRAMVRKEKGLPIFVELLCMDDDRVVCSVVRALRNLAVDQRNRELIGKYAMRELCAKIPNGDQRNDIVAASDETIAAVLATVNEVVKKHQEFARSFLDVGGVERLVYISQNYNQFSSKVVRFSFLVLQTLYSHHGLHHVYRDAGWKESHFLSKPPNMSTKTLGGTDTLGRTFSSQGATKFEDKTLPRGAQMPPGDMEEIPLAGVSRSQQGKNGAEPVYAQVNRAEKQRHRLSRDLENGHSPSGAEGPAGDSWV